MWLFMCLLQHYKEIQKKHGSGRKAWGISVPNSMNTASFQKMIILSYDPWSQIYAFHLLILIKSHK